MRVIAGLTVLLIVAWSCPCGADEEETSKPSAWNSARAFDLVCGPRCVQFLVRHYQGRDEDLIELVREVQWPELENGASMEALDRALRSRGIYTAPLKIGRHSRLVWPHPVLVHLSGLEAGGHYVAWMPTDRRDVDTMWVGLDGYRTGPPEKWAEGRTGYVLLTSPTPIADPLRAVEEPEWLEDRGVYLSAVGSLSVAVVALAAFRSFRRPKESPGASPQT